MTEKASSLVVPADTLEKSFKESNGTTKKPNHPLVDFQKRQDYESQSINKNATVFESYQDGESPTKKKHVRPNDERKRKEQTKSE